MEVIACIPELPPWPETVGPEPEKAPSQPAVIEAVETPPAVAWDAVSQPPATHPGDGRPAPATCGGEDEAAEFDEAERPSVARWSPPGRRRAAAVRFPTSSIVALAAVAVVVWVAAWRNDRLRIEADRTQRPDRIARQLPGTTDTPTNPRP